MKGETVFLYIISGLAALFVLYEGITLIIINDKTAHIQGKAIDVKTINTGRGKSKTARFTYTVNDIIYSSNNRINVPLYVENGTQLDIQYFLHNPNHISSHSVKRLIVGIGVAVLFFILAITRS